MGKKKQKKKIKKAIAAAGPTISKSEYEKIVAAAGGNTKQTLNQISKQGATLKSGTTNMLIRQQQQAPTYLGESSAAQAIYSAAGTPAQGGRTTSRPATSGTGFLTRGTVLAPTKKGKYKTTVPSPAPVQNQVDWNAINAEWQARADLANARRAGRQQPVANPNQGLLDEIAGLTTRLDDQDIMYQNMFDQSQAAYQQQMAEMSNMMNAQIAQAQQAYAQSVAAAEAEALQQQEAARAFMINQGRAVSPANLQIGSMYSQPRIGGTQAFKYTQPRATSSLDTTPAATAFTAPTLAASLQQPAVLNV